MSERTDYCKRLFRKSAILSQNLGRDEKIKMVEYMDILGKQIEDKELFVDDATQCKCKKRSDVLRFDDKNYCCDCLCRVKEKE